MVRKKDSKCSKLCIIQKNAGYAPSSTLVGMFLSKYKKMSTKTRDKYLFGCVDTAAVEGNPLPNWLDYPRKYRAQPPPPPNSRLWDWHWPLRHTWRGMGQVTPPITLDVWLCEAAPSEQKAVLQRDGGEEVPPDTSSPRGRWGELD